MKFQFPFLLLAGALLVSTSALAVQNAVLYGTVYDRAGKPMAGVVILLENAQIGAQRVTVTVGDGSYTIAEVQPAEGYRVTASVGGKKIDVREGIVVNIGDERVIVPALHEQVIGASGSGLGASGEVVPKAVEKGVTTELVSSAVSAVISGEQLRTLPLYNRNFLALGLLTPNTHDVEAGSALTGATFSIAGARASSTAFLMDGMDNVGSSSNQAIPFQVNDSIQEFRVISGLAPAEYGRNLGGVVNVVTRRAASGFHGSLFGYFGSDALNADRPLSVYSGSGFEQAAARAGSVTKHNPSLAPVTYNDYVQEAATLGYCTDSLSPTAGAGLHKCANNGYGKNSFFDPATILATNDSHTQPFDSKQFGVNLGGGVLHNKVFVFGSYEGTRIDNPNPVFERVPSSFDKTYNPLLKLGYPGATPFAFTSSSPDYQLASKVLALYPQSNVIGVPGVLEFFKGEAPNYTNVHNLLMRADVVQSGKATWTFRYSTQVLDQLHDATLPSTSQYPGNGALRNALNQNLSGTLTYALSNTITNEARVGMTRFRVDESAQDRGLDATTLGLPNKQMMTFLLGGIDPQYSGSTTKNYGATAGWADTFWVPYAFSTVSQSMYPSLDGLFPFARLGAPASAPAQRGDTTLSFTDNLTWSRGRHAFKFGGELRRLTNHFMSGGFARGSVVSGNIGEFTSDAETCGTCSDGFYAPSFDYALRQPSPYVGDFTSYGFAAYAHDTWRLHPRVTLTAGLRYEIFSPPSEAEHRVWNFDPAANGLVQEGGSQVVDSWGNGCGSGTRTLAYVYPDQSFKPGWTCNATGSGKTMASDYNNFAPRVGLAINLAGEGKTVLRFGFGIYYDQLPVSYAEQLLFNRPTPVSLTNPSAIYDQTFLSNYSDARLCIQCGFGNTSLNPANIPATRAKYQAASSPFGMVARDVANSQAPLSRQATVSLQQQFTNKLIVEAGYTGTFGVGLPVVTNSGFNNEWFCTITTKCDYLGPVFTMTNRGDSNYHSLLLRLRAAEWHGLRVNASYVYSRSMDNASNSIFPVVPVSMLGQLIGFQYYGLGNPYFVCTQCVGNKGLNTSGVPLGSGSVTGSDSLSAGLTTTGLAAATVSHYALPQDPTNFLHNDWAHSDFDVPHRAVIDFTWAVPKLPLPKALNDWRLSGIVNVQSGQPFTIFAGPIFGELMQRANVNGSVQMTGNPNAYISMSNLSPAASKCWLFTGKVLPGPGGPCLGNSGRNAFSGPGLATVDFAVEKRFAFGEKRSLMFRSEFFNLLNRANYYNPISELSTDGQNINPQFGQIQSSHDPRQIQLALRFTW